MEKKFKTNLNCGNCVARVTPFLNKVEGITEWKVDTENPDKVLRVTGPADMEAIKAAVKRVGFLIEEMA